MLKIYHNARCSKSRQTLELIQQAGQDVEVVDYLKNPPTAEEINRLLQKLDMKPGQLIRQGEAIFKENYKGRQLTDHELIAAMVAHPVLIERPIVVKGDKAVLGRPPENVQQLL
ncbi:arsenate reductase [Pontibacter akesuensis]|uniref:Arsenate reductase n=2 Tax=Pontibacter akesuensis TaxID=388950 RepID=A0A1I7GA46_9BACT|nr:arsenate reductase (glutaredoxin) [Pontibacter akesuensis]GHA57815.1 arsenate reductase [Pontibacter akesuensis]SFU45327.1 arsenate reductase [Pontibacter akesuensis]